jgi:hypothetical protein
MKIILLIVGFLSFFAIFNDEENCEVAYVFPTACVIMSALIEIYK